VVGSSTTLTGLTGAPVCSNDGARWGQVADLTIRLGAEPPAVEHVLVDAGRGTRYLVPLAAVFGWPEPSFRVDGGPHEAWLVRGDTPALQEDEILLGRDVLDTQIVDLSGQRVTRVSDIRLTWARDGSLVVDSLEVGLGAVLRRLGLKALAARLPLATLGLTDVHLTSARGHEVQLLTPSSAVHAANAVDLAHLLGRLEVAKAVDVIRSVGPERTADALATSQPIVGDRLVRAMPPDVAVEVQRQLPTGADRTHPHLFGSTGPRGRRARRLAGWRTHRPNRPAGSR
jgi:hypothetical protein